MTTVRLRSADLEWRTVDGEVILLDVRTSRYFAANRTAAALWPVLVKGATRDELAAQVAVRYDISAGQATADVDALVAQLTEQGLLEPE